MELTIKDICKYLPYGLMLENNSIMQSVEISELSVIMKTTKNHIKFLRQSKPLLRPLSQLIEEITHDGNTFVPIVELAKIHNNAYRWEVIAKELKNGWFSAACWQQNLENDYLSERNYSLVFSYSKKLNTFRSDIGMVSHQDTLFQKLYEWHFWTGDQSYFKKGLLIEKK